MAAASRIWVQDLMRFMGHALRNGLGLFHLRVERHQQEEQEVQDSAEPRHQGAERTRRLHAVVVQQHERHREDRQRDLEDRRSEEHTSELQSLMRISYAVFCLKKKIKNH